MNTTPQTFKSSFHRRGQHGYSLIELLSVIGLITILASLGFVFATLMMRTAQKSKLEQDIATLNSAIRVYTSNGGDLSGLSAPSAVLSEPKTTRSSADQKLHTGAPPGRMIDPRVVEQAVTVADWESRAAYSVAKQQFVLVDTDTAGVLFRLDESLNEMTIPIEIRSHGAVNYAKNETWIWDHGSLENPHRPSGQTGPNTGTAPPNSDPGAGTGGTGPATGGGGGGVGEPEPAPEPAPVIPRLPYPQYDKPGGAHLDTDFPLTLSLTNVPDAGIANTLIRVGSSAWEPYTGSVSVPMNTRVWAQYRAIDPAAYKNSYTNSKHFYPIVSSLSGNVSGSFHTPEGGDNLDTTISEGGNFFSNGNPTIDLNGEIIDAGEPNTLQFNKANITDVAPGQQFKIGDLNYHNYHNGTTFNDSHATEVTLEVSIAIQNPNQVLTFNLEMELVNTDNSLDDDASADYVRLTNLTQPVALNINGVGYEIQLEFGGADSFGFATSNQFHV